MKFISILFLFLFTSPSYADEICDELRGLEAQWNSNLPKKIDEYTELVQILVNCETRVVSYRKRILANKDLLPSGIYERKQRQHTLLHCNRNGLASNSGWIAMDVIVDINFSYLCNYSAKYPRNCLTGFYTNLALL